ncbi:hypothetical protein V2L05_03495 [Pseudomonas alliivorans]|nr:hypothetical protein [Pseudomonas alliivorans]
MKINLLPMRTDETLEVRRNGAVLFINDEGFDFSRMADGDTLPASAIKSRWFTGQVDHVNGGLEVTLVLPLPANYSPEQASPQPITVLADGPISLPQPLHEEPNEEVASQ